MPMLRIGSFTLDVPRPLVMGIVNLTPDSFSGDGLVGDVDRAIAHARAQWEAGADLLDIGAESTRPGAQPASLQDELARLLPVLREVTQWNIPVSVDSYKPQVMHAALECGVSMINDITGMTSAEARSVVAGSDCGVCLMHMQGVPLAMQQQPEYVDVAGEVHGFLLQQVAACRADGIDEARLVIDPGFGFGKTLAHNLELFRALPGLAAQAWPVLVGVSRKSMLGALTGRPVEQRLAASLSAAVLAAEAGAAILRVHDVAATKDALAVWRAIRQGE